MEKRYRALRTIGTIYKVLGILAGVITAILILTACVTSIFGGAMFDFLLAGQQGGGQFFPTGIFSGVFGGILFSIGALFSGGAASVSFYALGEMIYLLISLEENTRMTNNFLRKQLQEG